MKTVFALAFSLIAQYCFPQSIVEKYVREGISYHDAGQYQQALRSYEHALYMNPNSSLAIYEMSMTFSAMGEYDSAMKYAERVIDLNDGNLIPAFIVKGNAMEALGNAKAALKTYKNANRRMGRHYMILYNLGLTHFNLRNYKEAIKALEKGIKENPSHASSHLVLGKIMYEAHQPVQSLLALYYFLLMEPNSDRSRDALILIQKQLIGKTDGKADTVNGFMPYSDRNQEEDFEAAVLMLQEAQNLSKGYQGKTQQELFEKNTESLFKVLGEHQKKRKGPWWGLYVPFFHDLANSDHLQTYCYYISQTGDSNADTWLNANIPSIRTFEQWLRRDDS